MKKKKKEVFRKGDAIQLKQRRYVVKCGYQYDLTTVMKMAYKECYNKTLPEDEIPIDLYTKGSAKKNAVSAIWQRHKDFVDLRESAKVLEDAVRKFKWSDSPNPVTFKEDYDWWDWVEDSPPGAQNIYSDFVYKMVKEYLYTRLRALMKHGAERKIYFRDVPTNVGEHFWEVEEKKVVKTGSYFPPNTSSGYSMDDCDFEPGGLQGGKTHILLKCCAMTNYDACRASVRSKDFQGLVLNGKLVKDDKFYFYPHAACWLLETDCEHVYLDKDARSVADRLKVS